MVVIYVIYGARIRHIYAIFILPQAGPILENVQWPFAAQHLTNFQRRDKAKLQDEVKFLTQSAGKFLW